MCRNSLSAHTSDEESLVRRSLHTSAHTHTHMHTNRIYTFTVSPLTLLDLKKDFTKFYNNNYNNSNNNTIDGKTWRGSP